MKEFRKQVIAYFRAYKKLLKLSKSWKVRIVISNNLVEFANVEYDYEKKIFIITIDTKKNQNPQELRDSILHELLHIFLTPATVRIDLLLAKIRAKEKISVKLAEKHLDKIEEEIVDKLTKIILSQEKKV
jgi:hypothetical protein